MISDIRLQNFRSYSDDTFEFGAGVNIIVGPNASGKTNLLESILLIARGGSYRVSSSGLIRFESEWARVEANTSAGNRLVKIDGRANPLKKTFRVDDDEFGRLPQTKSIPVVLFEPDHLRLLAGSPERRRAHLDDLLEQTTPAYGKMRRAYQRALLQRNALLKKGPSFGNSQIFAWNIRLSELGGQVASARQSLTLLLNDRMVDIYPEISHDKTEVSLEYESVHKIDNYSSSMLRSLENSTDMDYQRGYTGSGPHRDDLSIQFDGRDVRDVASRGEVRTLLLSFKIVELELLRELRNQSPLLLLDDVFSELDGARRQALTNFLQSYQTFITTTDADVVVQHFMDKCTIIPISK